MIRSTTKLFLTSHSPPSSLFSCISLLFCLTILTIITTTTSFSSTSSSSSFVSAQTLKNPRPPGFYTASRMLNIRDQVVSFFRHAYDGYKKYAFPMDELKPLSCKGTDHFGRYSMTAIDSLDMLAIIGDYDEFFSIIDHLHQNVHFDADVTVSVFETTIRVIGSLTTAHDIALTLKKTLPSDQYPAAQRYTDQLLKVCVRIADKMISAFDTPTGIPFNEINLRSGSPDPTRGHATCPAAAGSLLLEFGYLSHLTGNCMYLQLARQAFLGLWKHRSPHNMVGMMIDIYNGFWLNTEANIGASVDSYYEYMVKAYVLSGDKMYLDMWEQASRSIYKHTYFSGWFLSSSVEFRGPMEAFDHRFNSLQTFWPGLQALSGDVTNAVGSFEKIHCVTKSLTFPPEYISIAEYVTKQSNPKKSGPGYPLRPEVIESTYFLHRATEDDYFLNVGEHFIQHFHRARTRCGFAAILDVWQMTLEDKMESFLLSETLKYLYLMFTPPKWKPLPPHLAFDQVHNSITSKIFNLDEGFIVNTEAHAIPITDEMKQTYKKCSAELHLLPHMSENVLKDDWSIHESQVYEKFSQQETISDINLHQRKCPVLDYWRDIAPAMDRLRDDAQCFKYVDTTILAPRDEIKFKPKQMPQPKPIQIVLPDGKKANVPSNMLTEAARLAAELRQSQHFRDGGSGNGATGAPNNKNQGGNNNNMKQTQEQIANYLKNGGMDVLMLEIPGDELNPIMSSPLRLQLGVPQRLKNQPMSVETQHGVLKVPMVTSLPMLFIGNSDQIVQFEFSTGLKNVGFLTGKAIFAPSVCMMKRPSSVPVADDEENNKKNGDVDSKKKPKKKNNSNRRQKIDTKHKLPEKSVSGPLFSAEDHKLCDGTSEDEVSQLLKRKIAIQYPELQANLTAGALRFGLLVLRGKCTFKEKIQRAQKVGASFVVIANQEKDGGLLEMADSVTPVKVDVTIPAVFITNKDYLSMSNYIASEEKKLEDAMKKKNDDQEETKNENNNNNNINKNSNDASSTTTSSPFPFLKIDAKIKCVEGVVDQFESIGISLLEVPNKKQIFMTPNRLKPVAQMLKEHSAGVFPEALMDYYYDHLLPSSSNTNENQNNNNKKIAAEELINQHRCTTTTDHQKEDCFFFLSYFMKTLDEGEGDNENNEGVLPSWSSLRATATRVLGSQNLVSLFSFQVGPSSSTSSSKPTATTTEEKEMQNEQEEKQENDKNNNNKNPSQYGIVGTVLRGIRDTNEISRSFKFSKPLTYMMSRPFMYFSKRQEGENQKRRGAFKSNDVDSSSSSSSASCQVLKIEIVNLADLRPETRLDFEGTEAGIQVLLRRQEEEQEENDEDDDDEQQQERKPDDNNNIDEKKQKNASSHNEFGICMRLVGEDPDKQGRYLIVTGFESEEAAQNYKTMPSLKTKFHDVHVLLLREKMSTVSEVTMDLKKNLGHYWRR